MYFDSSSSLICEKCRVHTLLIKVPQYSTLAPYKSHTELPYKHSKLAKIAKIRAVVCEVETDVDARASRIILSVFFSLPFYIVSTTDSAIQIVPREVYVSHYPYKHSKLAEIAKIRAVVYEDETDVDARASRIILSVFFSLPFYIVSTTDSAIQIVPREVYVSHYPYKHSKLAEIAKIRAVVCEDKITVKGMRGIAFEVWCFHFHCIVSTSDCAIPRKV